LIALTRPEDDQRFNKILLECIDETILNLLSKKVEDALYAHVERVWSVSRDEIPDRLDVLSRTLEDTFGATGSLTISRAIAKRLYSKLEMDDIPVPPARTLKEYIENARKNFRRRGGRH
jgi:hypothetical protein